MKKLLTLICIIFLFQPCFATNGLHSGSAAPVKSKICSLWLAACATSPINSYSPVSLLIAGATNGLHSGSAIAPAVQYSNENYPYAFMEVSNYRAKLNTFTKYKLKCDFDITDVKIGDRDNLKLINDEGGEKSLYDMFGPNSIILKTRYETYSYMEISKSNGKTVNIMLSVNKENAENTSDIINIGTCNLTGI